MQQVDNIIIGAGPGGYELAAMLCEAGESTVLVERTAPGGTCLNRGCIPTKCLCATAEAVLHARKAEQFGVNVTFNGIDYATARQRMLGVIDNLQQGVRAVVKDAIYVEGEARITSSHSVAVGNQEYTATKRIVIATGSEPARLPIPGAELAVTSDDVLAADRLPASAVIIGGGVIGLEFASIFNALGVETTVVEYCKEILPPFDSDMAKRLRTALSRRDINVVVGAAVESIAANADGSRIVTYQGKRGPVQVQAEMVVMAVGRRPVVPQGAAEVGVNISRRGFVEVDERMRTSVEGIYAIGDCNGVLMLAHAATAQARVVAEDNPALFDAARVPSVVFTTPEIAMVGPTPAALDAAGVSYKVVRKSFASNGKACAMGASDGTAKLLVDEATGALLGATVLGAHAADLVAEATLLVTDRTPLADLPRRYIHAHPTLSEILL